MLSSNFLVIVSAPNEEALSDLALEADAYGIATSTFRESDLNDEITAIAFQPGEEARQICSTLPLALRENKVPEDSTSGVTSQWGIQSSTNYNTEQRTGGSHD